MKFQNVYFFNGNAYAGKSTMVKSLSEKYGGVFCGENYHEQLDHLINERDFPYGSYTKNLKDWGDFIRRTPDEYEQWIDGVSKECETLELMILSDLVEKTDQKIFVDTNISLETLHKISDKDHVQIMLADPDISVTRFFERPDKEKQFLYQLLLKEPDPETAMANFRACLQRINSEERYQEFLNSGFHVILRDDRRSIKETLALVEKNLKLT